jgi:excinuclease ABC subunit C
MGRLKSAGLKRKAAELPEKPGIYFFRNASGEVVYIGKAGSLRDRVKSYFQPTGDPKVHNILAETTDIDYILTGSEREAAFLENNFVRQHQPRFNLKLKDDKNFPFIKVSAQEEYPGIYLCRRVEPDGARYFGPFSPAHQARRTIRLINTFFGLRSCEAAVFRNRKRPCLEYDLKYCSGPCVRLITPADYREDVNNALLFLEGKTNELTNALKAKMDTAAEHNEFEQAAHWRDTIRTVERLKDKPRLISVGQEDKDIWGFSRAGDQAGFLVFLMRKGRVIESKDVILRAEPEAPPARVLAEAVERFYQRRADIPEQVHVPFPPADKDTLVQRLSSLRGKKAVFIVPAKGKNKDLLDLAARNAETMMQKKRVETAALEEARRVLALDGLPRRIEGFDISNIGGVETVASQVVFEDGLPKKNDYKKYIIRTVEGPNDVASLKEVLERRFAEKPGVERNLPDLVLVDGGKGQVQAAREALRASGLAGLPLIALAKKEEIIFTQASGHGLRLERTSPALQLFQRIRDEAHRFAISFHRLRRTKRSFESVLDGIPGIGPKKKSLLLVKFRSLDEIRIAPPSDLKALIGTASTGALLAKIGGEESDHGDRDRD